MIATCSQCICTIFTNLGAKFTTITQYCQLDINLINIAIIRLDDIL